MIQSLIDRALTNSDRRVARQTLGMVGIMAVQTLGGIVQVSISARLLGLEGFGALAVIMAVASLVHGILSTPGGDAVGTFVTRGIAEGRPQEASRVLRFTLAVSLCMSFVAYAIIATVILAAGSFLEIDAEYTDAGLLYGVVGILMAVRTETLAVLRLADRVSLGLWITIVSTMTRVALLGVAWLTGGGMLSVVLAHVAGSAVNGIGLLVVAVAAAGHVGMTGFFRSFSIKVPSDVVHFQAGTFGKMAVAALPMHMDSIVVAQITGIADVGLYRGARQIVEMTRRPFYLIHSTVHTEYSRQWYSRQGGALRGTALRFTVLSFTFAAIGYAVLAVLAEPITRLILGDEFSSAANLLLIMIPGAFAISSFSALTMLPEATGRVWPSLAALAASSAAYAAAILLLAPSYGVEGAAWANAVFHFSSIVVWLPFIISILRRSRRL